MTQCKQLVEGLSQKLDKIAGWCIAGVMVLVVANILLRAVFNRPILGTAELVGFLTALGVGLGLAHCAVQNGHIAVEFIVERFPLKIQAGIDSVTNLLALGFWGLSAWHLGQYASSMTASGVVSSTAQMPIYPVIYLLALGLLGLCLVLVVRLVESGRDALAGILPAEVSLQSGFTGSVRKAMR